MNNFQFDKIFADRLCNMKRKHPSLTFIGGTTFLGLIFLINAKIGVAFEKNFLIETEKMFYATI